MGGIKGFMTFGYFLRYRFRLRFVLKEFFGLVLCHLGVTVIKRCNREREIKWRAYLRAPIVPVRSTEVREVSKNCALDWRGARVHKVFACTTNPKPLRGRIARGRVAHAGARVIERIMVA